MRERRKERRIIGTVLSLFPVVKTTVFLADMNDYQRVNEVYSTCEFQHVSTV